MEMYFGVGGELLTPLDEMLDGDIKLSLELDLELKDPLGSGLGGVDDWGGWGSLRTSPSLDIFGEKEACIMVSPEAVMPFIKREIKQEPPPRMSEVETEEPSLLLECEDDLENVGGNEDEEEEEEEVEEEEDVEEEDDEEEEEEVEEVKIQPKERNLWNSILTKPTVVKNENVGISYQARPKTEVVVSKTPSTNNHHQTVRVLHSSKSRNTDSPNPRSLLVKRYKDHEGYPKPAYSYSCLIAMALKNSITGSLPVSEIYNFMCEHFPYFKSAPAGWKNSVRHNLSLNKCFEKIEKGGAGGGCRKGCLWAMNPAKIAKMDDEVAKWSKKDPAAIRRSMKYPEELEKLERGDLKIGLRRDSYDSGAEEDSDSDSEGEEVPPSLKRFDSRLSSQESNDLGLPDEMYEELGLLEEVMSSDTEGELGPNVKRVRLGLEHYQRQPVRPV